jgi:hypothetical protein
METMKKLVFALEKAYFSPDLQSVKYGEYFDGEYQGYTCNAVFVEIKHREPYAMRLATLEKICKRYHARAKFYNTYGYYENSATVYEIIIESDYENIMQALNKKEVAEKAFWSALRDGKTQAEALQAIKTAVNAA